MYVSPTYSHSIPGRVISVVEMNTALCAHSANALSFVKNKHFVTKRSRRKSEAKFNLPLWICTRIYLGGSFQLRK